MALAAQKSKRPTSHSKKRSAQHHRQNKHYLKAYWPYIPMLLIVSGGLFTNSLLNHQAVLGASSDFSTQSLLNDTNNDRAKNHLNALTVDAKLQAAAQAKANDMVKKGYWAHTSPDGQTPWSVITASGYQYQAAGENLAYGFGSAASVEAGWMNSPEHRANILTNNYQNVGFGIANSLNFLDKGAVTVIVAEYAQPVAAVTNINFTVAPPAQVKGVSTSRQLEPTAQLVSRVQTLTNHDYAVLTVLVSALTGAAIAAFVIRHGFRLKRLISNGEAFLVHHPWFDILSVTIATVGLLLLHSSGFVR